MRRVLRKLDSLDLSPPSLPVVARSCTVFWPSSHCSQMRCPVRIPLSPHPEWRVTILSGLHHPPKSKSPPSPSYLSLRPSYAFPFDSFTRSRLQRQKSPPKSGRTSHVPHPVHPDDQARPFNRLGVGFLGEISVILDLEHVCFLGPSTDRKSVV